MVGQLSSLFPEQHQLEAFHPYYYQEEAVAASQSAHFIGQGRHIIEIPTGGGKTLMVGDEIRQYLDADPDFTALFLAPRKDLVGQTYEEFVRYFFRKAQVGMVRAEHNDVGRSIIIATPQTLSSKERLAALLKAQRRPFDMIIPDECHIFGGSWFQMLAPLLRPQTLLLGLSATPYRADGISLDFMFPDGIKYTVDFWELIASGHLVDVRTIDIPLSDYDLSDIDAEELNSMGESDALPNTEIVARLEASAQRLRKAYEAFMQMAHEKRTLLFAQSLDDARSFERYFTAKGVECAVITGKTLDTERQKHYTRFRHGELRLLIGFNVLTTGLDIREIECIIMARAIKNNRGLYTQAIGRGLRKADHIGKKELLLIHLTDKKHTLMTMGKLIGLSVSELPSVRSYLRKKLSEEERLEKIEKQERIADLLATSVYRPPEALRLQEIHAYEKDVFTGGGWLLHRYSGDYQKDYGTHIVRAERVGTGYVVTCYQKKRTRNPLGLEGDLLYKPEMLTDKPVPASAALAIGHQHIERLRIDTADRKARTEAHTALLEGRSEIAGLPATAGQIDYLQRRRVLVRGNTKGFTQGDYARVEQFLNAHKSAHWRDPETGVQHHIMVSFGKVREWITEPKPKVVKVEKERKSA